MALTLRGEKREGGIRIRSKSGLPIIEETWHYVVVSDTPNTTRLDVVLLDGLPRVNVTTSSSGLTVCRSKSAERRSENALVWDVTCEFSSEVDEGSEQQDPEAEDPNEWVPVYETKFERLQENVTKDVNGDPVENGDGEAFPTGLTISRFIPCWEFYQFEPASVSDEDVIGRNETLNDATFKGRAAETLLLTVLSSTVGFYYGQRRRLTKYSLKYNSKNWRHKRLNVKSDGTYAAGGSVVEFDLFPQIDFSAFLRT